MSKNCTLAETAKLLKEAGKMVIVSHISPDGDTLGSSLALAHALRMLGKEVMLNVDDDIPSVFSFLPGIGEYMRFAPDDSVPADLLIVIDASSADRAGNAMNVVKARSVLNIDHHKTNTHFADYLYLDSDAAATAEIIYSLLLELGTELNTEIATCIYEGLYTDTGSFKYSNTTSRTLSIASALLTYGVNPSLISDNMEVKSRSQVEMLGKVLETLTFLRDGKIAYVEVAPELYDYNVDTDTFVSYPRYIEGVEVALLFKQVEENLTRVSFRSKQVDVAKIALSFGGGGHQKASGCSIHAPLKEAESIVLPVVEELFP
ncbi:MAG: bifunctional oligoribonuclease/PAP phosphatase NrnA [Acidaminococcaceae bacterium]|jgi:phosphoesterase RecJ-like protein|nr:bifunctional oligoribonuclease/PAP phosphatase NrnA [Acidaminococcaceae bacterium]MBQ8492040.1 bifunctional oligoribonuclease/PAP phosphatase NrnA [Acidaminococcaceae bacterium]MBR1512303.1 bifunctional oligoribonuclease/PAP phosphatase NrnA [Acidaminococcaceae bacterium]